MFPVEAGAGDGAAVAGAGVEPNNPPDAALFDGAGAEAYPYPCTLNIYGISTGSVEKVCIGFFHVKNAHFVICPHLGQTIHPPERMPPWQRQQSIQTALQMVLGPVL